MADEGHNDETVIPASQSTIFGDFELLEEVARGGMGVVYRARQRSLDRVVALKLIDAGEEAGAEGLSRFKVEAQATARLDHAGIVPVYGVGEFEGRPYLAMGWVNGPSLAQRVVEQGPLTPGAAAALIRQAAEAVEYAHKRNVLHRDLKPGNVLIGTDGRARVTDFGLARGPQGNASLTASGMVESVSAFLSPEQAAGERATVSSDVYGLGATLYTALTGKLPFEGGTVAELLLQVSEEPPVRPRQYNPAIPAGLEALCLRCLSKNPADRPATARALAEDLVKFVDSPSSRGIRPVRRETPRKRARRIVPWMAAVAVVLSALGVGSWYWWSGRVGPVAEVDPDVTDTSNAEGTPAAAPVVPQTDEERFREALFAVQEALLPSPTGNVWQNRPAEGMQACERVLEQFEIPWNSSDPAGLILALKDRSPEFRELVLCLLEHWEWCAVSGGQPALVAALRQAEEWLETIDWRRSFRLARGDTDEKIVLQIARDLLAQSPTPEQIDLVALWLSSRSPATNAEVLEQLRATVRAVPQGYLPNELLAMALQAIGQAKPAEKASYFSEAQLPLRAASRGRSGSPLPHAQLAALFADLGTDYWLEEQQERDQVDQLSFPQAWPHLAAARRHHAEREYAEALVEARQAVAAAPELNAAIAQLTQAQGVLVASQILQRGGAVQCTLTRVPPANVDQLLVRQPDALPSTPFEITALSLVDTGRADADLNQLPSLVSLQELYLDRTDVTEESIRKLLPAFPRLRKLGLSGVGLTDQTVEHLEGLQFVNLLQTGVSTAAIERLLDRNPEIQLLHESLPSVPPPPEGRVDLGQGLQLDGKTSLEIPLELELGQPFTVELVVSVPAALRDRQVQILSTKEPDVEATAGNGFRLLLGEDNLITARYQFPVAGKVQAALPAPQRLSPPGRPVHLAVSFDGKTLFVFRDGVLLEWQGIQPARTGLKRTWILGQSVTRAAAGSQFIVDEVRISSIARYDREFILQLPLVADAGTEVLYHFDGTNDQRWQDSSGHGRQAVTRGEVQSVPGLTYGVAAADKVRPQFADAPPRAVAPYDADQARQHQEAWARHLGVPVEFTNSIGMTFRLIPPGEYLMGSTLEQLEEVCNLERSPEASRKELRKEEVPLHRVEITRPLWCGLTEVTYGHFQAFINATGYRTVAERTPGWQGATWKHWPGGPFEFSVTTPAFGISAQDAIEFCNWLSRQEDRTPAYRHGGASTWLPREGTGYRLPTEAEWEHACRAGTTTSFSFGEELSQIDDHAWTNRNSAAVPHAVALKKPNPFGLFDMHGNLAEWCQDSYREGYRHHVSEQDPRGPLTGVRVARSGSINDSFVGTRSSMRWAVYFPFPSAPTNRFAGFRVVRDAIPAAMPAVPVDPPVTPGNSN